MSILEALPWEPAGRSPSQFDVPDLRTNDAFAQGSGPTRRGVIYQHIRTHPGRHVRGMAKDLGLATGDLQYHLAWLEKNGYVKTVKTGFYRFVYPRMVFKEEQELLLAALSKDTPRKILLSLLQCKEMSQGDLARSLGCSQPTICWHIDRLMKSGVLKRGRDPGAPYEVAVDRDQVLAYLKAYHPEEWRRWFGGEKLMVTAGVKRSRAGAFQRAN